MLLLGSTVMVDMWAGLLSVRAGSLVAVMDSPAELLTPKGGVPVVFAATLLITLVQGSSCHSKSECSRWRHSASGGSNGVHSK